MKTIMKTFILLLAAGFIAVPAMASDSIDGPKLFNKKCKMCHSIDKKKAGPSLVSMNQDALVLRDVITNGSAKKRMMKAYGKKLSVEQIDALVDYIKSVQ